MPCQLEFDSLHSIARARFYGHITSDELLQYYEEGRKLAEQLNLRAGVADFTEATSVEITVQTIRAFARLRPVIVEPERPRVIIANKTAMFGMARLFESEVRSTRPNLHVVRTQREAWAVLGVVNPQFAAYPQASAANA